MNANILFAAAALFALLNLACGIPQKITFQSPSASIVFTINENVEKLIGSLKLSSGIDSIAVASVDMSKKVATCTVLAAAESDFKCEIHPSFNGSHKLTLTYTKAITDSFFDQIKFALKIGSRTFVENVQVTKCPVYKSSLFTSNNQNEATYGKGISLNCKKGYMVSNSTKFSPTDRYNDVTIKCGHNAKWGIPNVKCLMKTVYDFQTALKNTTTLKTKETAYIVCRNQGKMATLKYMSTTTTAKNKAYLEKKVNHVDNTKIIKCITSIGNKTVEKKLTLNVLFPPLLKRKTATLHVMKGKVLNATVNFQANPAIPANRVHIIKENSSNAAPNISLKVSGTNHTISIDFGKTTNSTFGRYLLTMTSETFGKSSVGLLVVELKEYLDEFAVVLYIASAVAILIFISIILCCVICQKRRDKRNKEYDGKYSVEKRKFFGDESSSSEEDYIEIDDAEDGRSTYEQPRDDLMYKNNSKAYQEYSAVYSQVQTFGR